MEKSIRKNLKDINMNPKSLLQWIQVDISVLDLIGRNKEIEKLATMKELP